MLNLLPGIFINCKNIEKHISDCLWPSITFKYKGYFVREQKDIKHYTNSSDWLSKRGTSKKPIEEGKGVVLADKTTWMNR